MNETKWFSLAACCTVARAICLASSVLIATVAGCANIFVPTDNTTGTPPVDGNRDGSLTSPLGKTSGEPNDSFSQAIVAVFDGAGIARLQGSVRRIGDLDVFLLGPFEPGDRIIVDADTTGSALDVSVAIFDDARRLVYNNDDRGGTGTRFLDSYIEWIVRHAGERYYLVVTHSAFAGVGQFTGSYKVDVRLPGRAQVPAPAGQILVLDFGGGEVDSPILGTFMLGPFDAGLISPSYQGLTEAVKETIRLTFEQNFERFNVTILTSDDPSLPPETLISRIFLGGFNANAFGIADGVDLYNADFCDDAVIFTESFEPRIFTTTPTAVEIGIAIGNVGSHEAGHLLGLNHVDDDRALMDDQSAADVFIDDQEFTEAPLSSDIMSIGTQDAVLLLDETVGPMGAGSLELAGAAFRAFRPRSRKP